MTRLEKIRKREAVKSAYLTNRYRKSNEEKARLKAERENARKWFNEVFQL